MSPIRVQSAGDCRVNLPGFRVSHSRIGHGLSLCHRETAWPWPFARSGRPRPLWVLLLVGSTFMVDVDAIGVSVATVVAILRRGRLGTRSLIF
ncbi:hypothetical protein EDD25_0386 [Cryobacterium psychrophilum]|nr:hypothetical protein EDD25_0386 [Cryobacterium psychrophilum]